MGRAYLKLNANTDEQNTSSPALTGSIYFVRIKHSVKILAIVSLVIVFSSCRDSITDIYLVNEPVYLSYTELRHSLKVVGASEIQQPGKIYFKGNYIFINEYMKGIHVVDNTNPASPLILKFIEIRGNVDMAVKGDILYADSYIDLVTIDVSDLDNITEVDRDTNVFPYVIPDFEDGWLEVIDQELGVITGYRVTERKERVKTESRIFQKIGRWNSDIMTFESSAKYNAASAGGSDMGAGGSMARFTIGFNFLYIIDRYSLKLFNLSDNTNPVFEKSVNIGWDIETIFPYQNKLFIGSQSGMYIYSIDDPANPSYLSEFRHANACDPVVAEGNYAYVTLRGGNLCGAIESRLEIIDISSITNPVFVSSYPMEEPYGLGIDDELLFVCDGDAGLKIYNVVDKLQLDKNLISAYPGIHAFDVIPLGNVLIMIGVDGLYQYDYSTPDKIVLLSHIPIYGIQ